MVEVFVNSYGARLWTLSQGAGLSVMLCNGGPGCCDYLAPVAQMLENVVPVIRSEQRGCGRSDSIPRYNIETCLTDPEDIGCHYGVDRWLIAGHSWGADLALIYALHYPETTLGLICMSGGRIHNDREWHQVYRQKRDQGLEALPAHEYPPNLEVNEQVNRAWKQYIRSLEGPLEDFAAEKERFGSDVLLAIALTPVEEIGGNRKPQATQLESVMLTESILGTQAELGLPTTTVVDRSGATLIP